MLTPFDTYRLVAAILGDVPPIRDSLRTGVDYITAHDAWPAVIELSSHHMVTTQLAYHLDCDDWRGVGEEERTYLAGILASNADRNGQMLAQLHEVVGLLNQAGIQPLALKGTARLLHGLYPHMGYRLQLDIDLLVQPGEEQPSSDALVAAGYAFADSNRDGGNLLLQPVTGASLPGLHARYRTHHHLPPLVRDGEPASVELHRHPYSRQFSAKRPLAEILGRADLHEGDLAYRTLSLDDELEHLVFHGYVGPACRTSRLLPLRLLADYVDLIARAKENPHWKRLERTFLEDADCREFSRLVSLLASERGVDASDRYLRSFESAINNPATARRYGLLGKLRRFAGTLRYNPASLRGRL